MKRFNLLLAISLVSIACGSATPASAQGFSVQQGLPKVKSHVSRIKVQILDSGPEITDCRTDPQVPQNLHIMVPPKAVSQAQDVYVQLPGGAGGPGGMSGGGGQPAPVGYTINMNRPAPARFDSNIPVGGPRKPGGLAPGQTTNLLAGQSVGGTLTPGNYVHSHQVIRRMLEPTHPGVPTVMTQPSYESSSGAGNASSTKSKSSVVGKLYPRGSLLEKSPKGGK